MDALVSIIVALVTGLIGFAVGSATSFRDQKQRAYGEFLPPIAKAVYTSASEDEAQLNRAIMTLWLYGSKKVAKKMDSLLGILVDSSRGNPTEALQDATAAMRKDIQLFPWQRLNPQEVQHLYLTIVNDPNR